MPNSEDECETFGIETVNEDDEDEEFSNLVKCGLVKEEYLSESEEEEKLHDEDKSSCKENDLGKDVCSLEQIKKENEFGIEQEEHSEDDVGEGVLVTFEACKEADCNSSDVEVKSEDESLEDDPNVKIKHDITPEETSYSFSKKPFTCNFCPYSTSFRASFTRHLKKHTGHDLLTCPHCDAKYIGRNALMRHITSHTVMEAPTCQLCGQIFSNRDELLNHTAEHSMDKKFKCNVCGMLFCRYILLRQHKATHKDQKMFACEICGKTYAQSGSLFDHKQMHKGEKKHECSVCGKKFWVSVLLKRHMRIHTGERPYVCPFCGLGFTILAHLQAHKRTHTGERPYKCLSPACPQAFTTSSAAKRHYIRIHSKPSVSHTLESTFQEAQEIFSADSESGNSLYTSAKENNSDNEYGKTTNKVYQCHLCTYLAPTSEDFEQHEKMHLERKETSRMDHSEQQFMCSFCGASYSSQSLLLEHMQSHVEQAYTCHVCSEQCPSPEALYEHSRIHPQKSPFECDSCRKTFRNIHELSYHKCLQPQVSSYKCQHCGIGFPVLKNLRNHEKTHVGERPYQCSICPRSFMSSSALNRHCRRVHFKK